jgi:polysaccharide pyruvyl transferase WcaK-like protein
MSESQRMPTIAVLGHYHGRNLGDDLVVETILAAIRKRIPGADTIGISLAPEDTERRHNVRAFPINPIGAPASGNDGTATRERSRSALRAAVRRVPGALPIRRAVATAARLGREVPFVLNAYRLLRGVDTIVVAGSGPLLDAWRGAWAHPYTILRWSILARLTRTRLLVPSIGAGPIRGFLGRFIIRRIVAAADFISVRDPFSAELLHSIGVTRDLPVRPDMAYGYPLPEPPPRGDRRAIRVGVNVMAHEDPRYWPKGDGSRFDAYLDKMVEFVERLLAGGHEVVVFSSQTSADALVAADLLAAMGDRGLRDYGRLRNAFPEIAGAADLVRTIQSCDYVVASRFHSVLIPLTAGIPTLGLAYHAKTEELFARVDRREWCLDIDAFSPDDLSSAFAALRAEDSELIREQLRSRAADLRAVVESQFDEILCF